LARWQKSWRGIRNLGGRSAIDDQRGAVNNRSRRTLATGDSGIDELPADAFKSFVDEGRSIRWIASELNRLNAPGSVRHSRGPWHVSSVYPILRRRKYIGIWPWAENRNVRDPETGSDRVGRRWNLTPRHRASKRLKISLRVNANLPASGKADGQ
jgi:hypothetical protein